MISLFKMCFAQIIFGEVTWEIYLAISFYFFIIRICISLLLFFLAFTYHIQILTNITHVLMHVKLKKKKVMMMKIKLHLLSHWSSSLKPSELSQRFLLILINLGRLSLLSTN